MRCPACGHDDPEGTKFCTSCGAPIAEAPTRVQPPPPQQPTTQMPSAPVATPVYAPVQPPKKSSKKVWIAAVAIVLGLCIVAAAVIIPLVVIAANNPVAQVTSVKLARADGETLSTSKVPLDTEILFKATFKAKFKNNGSGSIQLVVIDSANENVMDKTYDVTSSGELQSKEMKFTMEQGSGKPLRARAKLSVTQGAKKLTDGETLSFTMVAGKSSALQLKEATEAATKKCQEATDTLKATAGQGINVSDLADRLSKALTTLQNAKTAAEANGVTQTAQGVIDECNARIAAAAQNAKNADTCRQNQAVIRAKLVDWWSGNGNFPNSMSQLSGLPTCPSGGTYTYFAPDTTPATLHVSCSVHGEL